MRKRGEMVPVPDSEGDFDVGDAVFWI